MEHLAQPPAQLPWQPISETDVYRSLKAAKASTAPGEDGLPMLIWKRLWRHLGNLIDRAWHGGGVVSLVAFDLKGAFNGVNKISPDARFQSKGIPAVARRWIASFMSGRQANIGFDDYLSEVAPQDNAGLAQGSPLSPILFAFFNCDLVDQPVDFHGGASAFIDDYFRWRVGWYAEEKLAKI